MTIRLRFVNSSLEAPPPDVFLYQRDQAPGPEGETLVWKRIRRCLYGWNHPLCISDGVILSFRYDGRNWSRPRPAAPGDHFLVQMKKRGGVEVEVLPPQTGGPITIRNTGRIGEVEVFVLRNDRPLVRRTLGPGAEASFSFPLVFVVGADRRCEEGEPLAATPADRFHAEIDLQGIVSADLVMTGGGPGPGSTPLRFELANIERVGKPTAKSKSKPRAPRRRGSAQARPRRR